VGTYGPVCVDRMIPLSDRSRRRIIPFYPSNPGPLTIISVAFLLPNPFRLMAMSFFFLSLAFFEPEPHARLAAMDHGTVLCIVRS